MSKGLKSFLKLAVAMVCILIALLGGLALYVTCSPQPVVWLLRNQFGDEVEIQNVDNYEEIKNNVTIYKDFVYPSADERNTYDIYLPKNADEDLPTIVWVHGGAFVAGTKDGIENYAVMLANEGYAVVGMDYQWAPEIQYPGQVRQVEECLVALESVKSTYHLDLNKIILIGDSAGAHIAAQAVLLATNPGYEQAIGIFSAITAEQLSGAVLYCGPYDVSKMLNTGNKTIDFFASRIGWALLGEKHWQDGEMIKTTTIKDYTTAQFPPVFITDGNSGSFESQGKELADDLRNEGRDVTSLFFDKNEYGEVGHEYQFSIGDGGAGSLCYQQTILFLDRILSDNGYNESR